jgi:type IV secretory pathway VirD2 relaxase
VARRFGTPSSRRRASSEREDQASARLARIAVLRPIANTRRVVVKAHYVKLTEGGAKAAALHLRYIERDGVERDGSKGVLYGPEGPVRRETFEQPRLQERHLFRLIVSPEDGDQLDMTAYVRSFMGRVEKDLGRKLEWTAVNHHDTDHPHAHIVLRGVDRAGRELRLDRSYISNGLRWRAQELATEELGPRPKRALEQARQREITQERFTSLDRELERRATDSRVDVASVHGRSRPLLVARLEQLEHFGLAERTSAASWTLRPGWQKRLRDLGIRGDIVKQMHVAMSGDPSRYRVVRPGEPVSPEGEEPPRPIARTERPAVDVTSLSDSSPWRDRGVGGCR